jgi:transcriptional regulator with XRE-family HTH domain
MGRSRRERPKHLGRKLLLIRKRLGLSQTQMCKALGLSVHYSAVSNYELGTREPPLLVLLRYAQLYGTSTDILINDKEKLPERDKP